MDQIVSEIDMKTIDQLPKIKYLYSMFINKNVLNSFEEHSSRLLDSVTLNLGHKLGRTLILKITKILVAQILCKAAYSA